MQQRLDFARKELTIEDAVQQKSNADLKVLENEKDERHNFILTANLNDIT
jgi:hypothetical protein